MLANLLGAGSHLLTGDLYVVDAHEILVGLLESTTLTRDTDGDLTWGWIEGTGLSSIEPGLAEAIEEFIRQEDLNA